MRAKAWEVASEHPAARLHLRTAWLCGVALILEGYDIATVGYAMHLSWPLRVCRGADGRQYRAALGPVCVGLPGDQWDASPCYHTSNASRRGLKGLRASRS
jgi:hypothetical protein